MSKAIMLAAGRGSRIRASDSAARLTAEQTAAAGAGQKALVPIAGAPLIAWLMAALEKVGVNELCLVVAPHSRALRQAAERYRGGLKLHFAVQEEPRGTADALLTAGEFPGDERFLVVNSDNYYPVPALERLTAEPGWAVLALDGPRFLAAGGSNVSIERFAAYARLHHDGRGTLRRIVEKPPLDDGAPPGTAGVNAWSFGSEIFAACRAVGPSVRGELELPDAAQHAIDHLDIPISVVLTAEPVLDLSTRSDVEAIERLLPDLARRDHLEPPS